jgi:5'-nucleotidase
MLILLCNDDGIYAPGITAIAQKLVTIGEVYVAAPVAVKKAWSISGTPTDCAKIAIANLLPEKPDLVVSGINRGPNLCVDIFYSGTVAAAFEGAFKGITSVALSLDDFSAGACYDAAADWGLRCIKIIVDQMLGSKRLFNINVPGISFDEIKGIKLTKTGVVDYRENYEHRVDPYGRSYYWIRGNPEVIDKSKDTDVVAVKNGYVSVTPLVPQLTDFSLIQKLDSEKTFII